MDELRSDREHDEEIPDENLAVPADADVFARLAAYGDVSTVEDDSAQAASTEHAVEPEPMVVADDPVEDSETPQPELVSLVLDEAVAKPSRFGRAKNREPKTRTARERRDKRPKRLVGLKIGASQLAAAQIVNNGAPELTDVFREPLEQGLVVSGEIRDPDGLGDAIKRFFELHKLPKSDVRLGIANNRIGVRIFEIEGVSDPRQLENAIRFRAEEVLPIPLDDAVLDYVVLDERGA